MNFRNLLLSQGVATSLVAIALALPASLGAQTSIAQADIESYFDTTNDLYVLNDSTSYENSGSLNFGTTSSGDNLAVGRSTADNFLTISGGTVTNYRGYIGYYSAGTGTVTVTGASSVWSNANTLTVGYYGTGTLNIENGGSVSNTNGYVGDNSSGTVTVTGANSTWENSGILTVGRSGTGTLTIEDGAQVTATSVSVGSVGDSAIYLNGGYLALASADATTDLAIIADLINNEKVYAMDAATGTYVLVTSWDSENGLVSLTYYEDITTCDALDVYNLTGAYTVLTSAYHAVPEPATYALFGGLGALGMAMYRRRTARK